jgi:hypothetical protein
MPGITPDDHGEGIADQGLAWRSSAACTSNGCVEAATTRDGVAVRDSHDPDHRIEVSRRDWDDFVAGVKAGDFDAV